jgi:hypothetical protein
MLDRPEIDGLRRSATMAPLAIGRLWTSMPDQLAWQGERTLAVLDDLRQSWTVVRWALNELNKIVAR